MSKQTVFVETRRTFNCKECKRSWVILDGDIIHPPEECPFCKLAKLEKAMEAFMGLSMMRHIMILFPSVKRIYTDIIKEKIAVPSFLWPFTLSSTEIAAWSSISPRMREHLLQERVGT